MSSWGVDNKDSSSNESNPFESNPQFDMMSKMLNLDASGLGGIMNIANKVSQKFQQKVENGDLNPEDLMASAQNMLSSMQQNMQQTPNNNTGDSSIVKNVSE